MADSASIGGHTAFTGTTAVGGDDESDTDTARPDDS
jgi:hypothetical protein